MAHNRHLLNHCPPGLMRGLICSLHIRFLLCFLSNYLEKKGMVKTPHIPEIRLVNQYRKVSIGLETGLSFLNLSKIGFTEKIEQQIATSCDVNL